MEAWSDFFVAEAGAAAALAGLLFVAVSINLTRILEYPHLPMRAVEALTAIVSVLAVSTVGLIPHQPNWAYGVQIATCGLIALVIQALALRRTHEATRKYQNFVALHAAMNLGPPLLFVIAGGAVASSGAAGAGWIAGGVLASFATGILGAWVLLIEINR